jgi:hypothetical protein
VTRLEVLAAGGSALHHGCCRRLSLGSEIPRRARRRIRAVAHRKNRTSSRPIWPSSSRPRRRSSPQPCRLRYRDARAAALAAGRPFTDTRLAQQLGCRHATISNWKQDAQFLEWLDTDAREAVRHYCAPVLLRTAQSALNGSIAHAKLLFQVLDSSPVRRQRYLQLEVIVAVPRPQGPGTSSDETSLRQLSRRAAIETRTGDLPITNRRRSKNRPED